MKIKSACAILLPFALMGCALLGGREPEVRDLVTRGAPICGNPLILGEPVGRVEAETPGCGISDAVRVNSVSARLKPSCAFGPVPAETQKQVGGHYSHDTACTTDAGG